VRGLGEESGLTALPILLADSHAKTLASWI